MKIHHEYVKPGLVCIALFAISGTLARLAIKTARQPQEAP